MTAEISTHQKAWQYIRALNASEEQLDAKAFIDVDRNYTYRQFFQRCDRYAEVFSALGMTEVAGARVGIVGSMSVKCLVSFFALNSMGVSVSIISADDLMAEKWLLNAVKVEGITDLLLPDTIARPEGMRKIMKKRKKLGLRNVIVFRTSKQTPKPTPRAKLMFEHNLKELRKIPGVLYMRDLLRKYAGMPIAYGSSENDEAAIIVHTSGTTKGTHKPIPLSDVALNTTAARMLADQRFSVLRDDTVVFWGIPIALSTSFVNVVYCSLAFGCAIEVGHGIMDVVPSDADFALLKKHKKYAFFGNNNIFNALYKKAEHVELDFSGAAMVIFGGDHITHGNLKRAHKFMRKHGGDPVIVNGYGLSECGAANTMGFFDKHEDHGIGQPLAGVSVLVKDEQTGEVFTPDGQEHTGILYLSSESNSSGRLGDTVFFEPEFIDGKPYICTNDLVRIAESGDMFFLGRGNRFFVNNEGIKFDAGLVQTTLSEQKGIEECALVAFYEKMQTHDTVPMLYATVKSKKGKGDRADVVRRALKNAYLNGGAAAGNNLPWLCVIADDLPHNAMGKVDLMRIQVENTPGKLYSVVPIEKDGKLVDVRLVKMKSKELDAIRLSPAGVPEELRKDKQDALAAMVKTLGPDYLLIMAVYGPAGLREDSDGMPPAPAKDAGAQAGGAAPVPMLALPMPWFMPLPPCLLMRWMWRG